MQLTHLTDTTLLNDTKFLAQKERTLTTQVLWHLREIDRRKLYADVLKDALLTAVDRAKQQKFKTLKTPHLQLEVKPEGPKKFSARGLKRELFARAGHRCQQCRSTFALEIDHLQPTALGGANNQANLRILCRNCNQRAGIRVGLRMTSQVSRSSVTT